MLNYLRQKMSIANIGSRPCGQIATLLILMLVVLLIFILVTVNLGNTSLVALELSNAADSAVLVLASQLSTKANVGANTLYSNNGGDCDCDYTGCVCSESILEEVLAGFLILVYVVVCIFYPPAWSVAPYVIPAAGTLGGAIGGSISGEGWGQGAITGFQIGASIAGGKGLLGGLGLGTTLATIGSITLTTAGEVTTEVVKNKQISAALSNLSKALKGVGERDEYRENAILQAFIQTVDDPNEVVDTTDIDADGDVLEKVPAFLNWYEQRVAFLKNYNDEKKAAIEAFIEDLIPFKQFFDGLFFYLTIYNIIGDFNRIENGVGDGRLVAALRQLRDGGYPVTFWWPGNQPTPPWWLIVWWSEWWDEDWNLGWWSGQQSPEYYDEVHDVYEFDNMLLYISSSLINWEIAQGGGGLMPGSPYLAGEIIYSSAPINYLFSNLENWQPLFYSGNGSAGLYDDLGDLIDGYQLFSGLNHWISELESIRSQLPENSNLIGQVNLAEAIINGVISQSQQMRDAIMDFINEINEIDAKLESYREEPASYMWADSRCPNVPDSGDLDGDGDVAEIAPCHEVKVEVSDFKIPYISESDHWHVTSHDYCVNLNNYSDNGSSTWVEITRKLPVNKEMGVLGMWNPFGGEIKRKAKASYSWNHVELTNPQ